MKPITVTWSDGCPCGGVSIGSLSGLPPADEASCAEVEGNRLRCMQTAGQCNPERELPSLTLEPGKATAFPETLVLQRDGHGCDYGPLPKTGGPAEYSVSVAPGLSGPPGGWRNPATRVKMPAPPVACPSDTPLVIPGGG